MKKIKKIILINLFLFFMFFSTANIFASNNILTVSSKSINVYEKFDIKTIQAHKEIKYNYSVSDSLVASINENGIVIGNKLGNTVITISDENGNTEKLELRVGYYKGIDISTFNNSVDFSSIKKQGIDFVMIRSSYGWYDDNDKANGMSYDFQYDVQLYNNIKGACENNIPFGIYHYSYAQNTTQAALEAEYTINALKSLGEYSNKISLPIAYDVEDIEYQGSLDKTTLTDIVITYCTKIREAGFAPMIYANKNWFVNHLDTDRLNSLGYDFWYAMWPEGNIDFSTKIQIADSGIYPLIWQYTSSGYLSGANTNAGTVDFDIMYMKEQVKLTFVSDGQVIKEKGIDKGTNTIFPKVTKTGYTFVKWIDENSNEVNENTIFNNNSTLTAIYQKNSTQKGDINRDGRININDVNYGLRGISKGTLTDEEKEIGNVNGDSVFNINDINKILRFLVGKVSSL